MSLDDSMYSDTIYVIKKDGKRSGPFRAVYDEGRIATRNAEPDIEDGDTIVRKVGNREELYVVLDNSYSPGLEGEIEPFYNAFVRKSTAPAPAPNYVTFNTNFHGATSGVQVGDQNQMQAPVTNRPVAGTTKQIFIVHGRDEQLKEAAARFLEKLGLLPIILHEQADKGRTVIEKFEQCAEVGFAVVLLTPDDIGSLKDGQLHPRARQNVIFELGYFIGRLGRERVVALHREGLELPSDYAGVIYTSVDAGGAWKFALARELKAAGMDVDLNRIV
jgi:predicted nucleotide-binding protein